MTDPRREDRWRGAAPLVALAVLASGALGFAISGQLMTGDRLNEANLQNDEERNQEILRLCVSNRPEAPRLIAKYLSEMDDRSMRLDFLTMAAYAGRQDIVQTLVAKGYPVTGLLSNNAPVFGAVRSRRVELVRYLLGRGASVRSRARAVLSPFPPIITSNDLEMLLCVLEAGASVDEKFPLWGTLADGRYLRLHQVGIDARSEEVTPLIFAVILDRSDLALVLLHRGAGRSVRSGQGFTALDYAKKLGFRECEQVLVGR
jgi:ankyrin repeat protein